MSMGLVKMSASDATSLGIVTGSVFMTGDVNTDQRRAVAFLVLPGAFFHTNVDEKIDMTLRRELCKLMCTVRPKLDRKYEDDVNHNQRSNETPQLSCEK